jgi:acyl-coenzyme A synthetase/AMP-(fatty) acid ligase
MKKRGHPEGAIFNYRELEDYLLTNPAVEDVAVIPGLVVGGEVCAYVIPRPGVFDPDRLEAFFLKKLKSLNLNGFIEYRDSLPRSDTGKLYIRMLLKAVVKEG